MIKIPSLNYEEVVIQISNFLRRALEKAYANGYVMGLSGGVDSSVTAALAVRSVKNIKALIMPEENITPKEDIEDAIELCNKLGIDFKIIYINEIKEKIVEKAGFLGDIKSLGNLSARIRMILLYYYANSNNFLVLGTGDKSEILLGYFTKYGDGGVDVLPIADLYKTQVRELGKYLGLSEKLVMKKSSPRLWAGQEAEIELGISYDLLDKILFGLVELELNEKAIAEDLGLDVSLVKKISERVRMNEHKRRGAIICQLGLKGVESGYRLPVL